MLGGCDSFTGYLGVFLVLLAFAIGPFVQLALNFQESTGVALLNRCENFIYKYSDINSSSPADAADALVMTMKGIVISEDYNQSSGNNQYVQALKKDCDTGNCNWDAFSSLGYCANCTNVTEHILTSCIPDTTGDSLCNYTLPNGQLVTNVLYSEVSNLSNDAAFSVNYSYPATLSSSLAYQNWDNGTTFGLFSVLQSEALLQSSGFSDYAVATECVFYICIQAIHSQVINNTLYENIQPNSFYHTTSQPPNVLGPMPNTTYVVLQPPQSQWAALGLDAPTNFTIDSYSWFGLAIPISNVLYDGGTVSWEFKFNNTDDVLNTVASQDITDWGPFWNEVFVSMNAVLRATCPQSEAALGVEQNLGLVVNVRWPWLALPASIVLLTTIFLCIVAIDGHKHGVPVWKTSILAHHVHGLPDDVRSSLAQKDAEKISDMKEWAKRVEVRLEFKQSSAAEVQGEDQWLLRRRLALD
jgi:hypothetical protein